MRLQGKAAVVTGAASGMGRACAILFAENGAKVLAVCGICALLLVVFVLRAVLSKPAEAPAATEAPVAAHLKGLEVTIGVDLGLAEGRATVWTCDLTHGYISINADYRS